MTGGASFADERHFFAPVDQISNVAQEWKTSRLEEYWVRDAAVGTHRVEYEVALPVGVRLTNLGIRQVPTEITEAGRSYGATSN